MWTIQIKNLKELQATFDKYPAKSAEHFGKAISTILLTAQRYAIMGAPVDTGKLRASWDVNVGIMEGSLKNTTSYAYFVAVGRKKGKWPPKDEITKWANRKGISPFLVARKIYRDGIEPNPFFENAIGMAEKIADHEFHKAMENTLKEIVKK